MKDNATNVDRKPEGSGSHASQNSQGNLKKEAFESYLTITEIPITMYRLSDNGWMKVNAREVSTLLFSRYLIWEALPH